MREKQYRKEDAKVSRRKLLGAIGASGVAATAGCLGDDESETTNAAWMLIGTPDDNGWNQMHEEGRQAVEAEFDWVETTVVEDVSEGEADRVLRDLSSDNDIIFATSFGYQDAMLEISENNPDTAYEHCSGVETGENMGQYYGRMYEGRYLSGVAAGLLTETDSIGVVAPFIIAANARELNGFAAGVMDVNEDAVLSVRWTNEWFDPTTESAAAQALIEDENCDVLTQLQDSPSTVSTAEENNLWASGSNAPMNEFGGDWYLTNGIWDWGEIYIPKVEAVHNDEWEAEFVWEGMETGAVDLAEFGPEVPTDVIEEVEQRREQIEDGTLDVWEGTRFEGEDDDFLYFDMEELLENFESEEEIDE